MTAKRPDLRTLPAIRPDFFDLDVKCPLVSEPDPVRCPHCESSKTKVTKTMQTIPVYRYRVCRRCGQSFKTIQGTPDPR